VKLNLAWKNLKKTLTFYFQSESNFDAFTDDELAAADELDADILEKMEREAEKAIRECSKTLR
jgi:hypothetical protein